MLPARHSFLTTLLHTDLPGRRLGVLMAFTAGAVNAGGFLAVGHYTSHMTGVVSSISDLIAHYQWQAAVIATLYLLAFAVGAMTSCITIQLARARQPRNEFAPAILLEALLLLVFGVSWSYSMLPRAHWSNVTISLLCFIMGMQNAIITKLSRTEIRTTHVTGLVTDIGIEIGRLVSTWFPSKPPTLFQRRRLALHVILLAVFLTGGVVGVVSFQRLGFITTIPLAMALAVAAILPSKLAPAPKLNPCLAPPSPCD